MAPAAVVGSELRPPSQAKLLWVSGVENGRSLLACIRHQIFFFWSWLRRRSQRPLLAKMPSCNPVNTMVAVDPSCSRSEFVELENANSLFIPHLLLTCCSAELCWPNTPNTWRC